MYAKLSSFSQYFPLSLLMKSLTPSSDSVLRRYKTLSLCAILFLVQSFFTQISFYHYSDKETLTETLAASRLLTGQDRRAESKKINEKSPSSFPPAFIAEYFSSTDFIPFLSINFQIDHDIFLNPQVHCSVGSQSPPLV